MYPAPLARAPNRGQSFSPWNSSTSWLVWRRPRRERLAFGLLITSCILMAILFLIGVHGSFVPGVNL